MNRSRTVQLERQGLGGVDAWKTTQGEDTERGQTGRL